MGACPIHDVKCLVGTELQIGQFGVLLQDSDSDAGRTETILAQPVPEQIEWYRWRGAAGQGRAGAGHTCQGMSRSFGRYRESVVFPREGSCQRLLVKMKRSRGRDRDDSARSGQFQ
jgi:hypothetical protein